MPDSLTYYFNRPELSELTEFHRRLLTRYCKLVRREDLSGRALAYGLMRFNNRNPERQVNNDFINWLYYY